MLTEMIVTFLTSFMALFIFRRLAYDFRWLDSPCSRKQHQGNIPLVGGLSIWCGVVVLAAVHTDMLVKQYQYIIFSSAFVAIGFLDDKYDLSAKLRLALMCVLSSWLVVDNIGLYYIGNIFGRGDIFFTQIVALIMTIAAIIGCATAFNMIDGLNGLLSAVSLVTFIGLALVFQVAGQWRYSIFCLGFIAAMLPYMIFNLCQNENYRVFLGDAGSTLVGVTIVWLLLFATQPNSIEAHPQGIIKPAYVLWFIALPLMDMVSVMFKRLARGQSPLKADRRHIHHIMLERGMSGKSIVVIALGFSAVFTIIGVLMHLYQLEQAVSFISFLLIFVCYLSFTMRVEKYCYTRLT